MLKFIHMLLVTVLLLGCDVLAELEIYSLYRDSPIDRSMRIHMATFDSKEGGASIPTYNKDNCEIAADLFSSQSGVTSKYWCEKGHYRR